MSASRELTIVATVACVPTAVLGFVALGQEAVLGAGIAAALLYGLAAVMRFMDGKPQH